MDDKIVKFAYELNKVVMVGCFIFMMLVALKVVS